MPNASGARGASIVIHAEGTWTYMIFWRSPMSRSGGEMRIAVTCEKIRKRKANHPNSGRRPARAVDTAVRDAAFVIASCLYDGFEYKESPDKEDDVEDDEQPRPRAGVAHDVAAEQGLGRFHCGEENGNEH